MIEEAAGPANWRGRDLQNSDSWIYCLDDAETAEVKQAVRRVIEQNTALKDMTTDDFSLPFLAPVLNNLRVELEEGVGLKLLRGFPIESLSTDHLRVMYWGIGLHVGTAVSQSNRNDYLGDVRNIGTPHGGPNFRGYTSNGNLTYHVDAADVTGLFCLSPAKKGGLSRIVSSLAVHNEILEIRPDLLEVLYRPYWWSMQGNELPGTAGFYTQPIFAVEQGYFACRYTRTHIRSAEMNADLPDLTPMQSAALDLLDEVCARQEFNITMMFEPGDIQFLNNHLTLHTRTAFEDSEFNDQNRHLMRLWLSLPNGRPLSSGFKPFYRHISAGAVRGGFPGQGEMKFQTL